MKKRISIVLALIAASLVLFMVWIQGALESPPVEVDAAARGPTASIAAAGPISPALLTSDDAATADGMRAVAAAPAADAVGPIRPASEALDATLVVRCVSKGTTRPLERIRVRVSRRDNSVGSISVRGSDPKGTLQRSAVSGSDGEVEFAIPSGLELRLRASPEQKTAGGVDQGVPALRTGERRILVIPLTVGDDLHSHGIVMTRGDRTPIAGAKVLVLRNGTWKQRAGELGGPEIETLSQAVTGGDGRFEVATASWKNPYLRVEAEGYGPTLASLSAGSFGQDQPQVITLERGAAIDATVIDGRGAPLAGALVSVRADGFSLREEVGTFGFDGALAVNVDWSASTATDGRCTLKDLPARVPLSIAITNAGKVVQKSGAPVSLEVDELRSMQFRIGGGCVVMGALLDEKGKPVASHEVWLVRATFDRARYFLSFDGQQTAAKATTDREGKFTLEDVQTGRWWIGPAPGDSRLGPRSDHVAPLASLVEVPPDTPRMDIVVQVQRGLYIRGRVVDSKGAPASRSRISARAEGTRSSFPALPDDAGDFILGPLMPGSFQLTATGSEWEASSDFVTANAGDENVVLRLRAGGTIEGKVVDATSGEGCRAELRCTGTGSARGGWGMSPPQDDGSFQLQSLVPGTYDLIARAHDGRVAISRGIVVDAGSRVTGVVLTLELGGKVRVRYDGTPASAAYDVLRDGVRIASGSLEKGVSSVQVVPKGRLSIELRRVGDTAKQSREIEVAPGEEKEVVFNDAP